MLWIASSTPLQRYLNADRWRGGDDIPRHHDFVRRSAHITEWFVRVADPDNLKNTYIETQLRHNIRTSDGGNLNEDGAYFYGYNLDTPGVWSVRASVPDAGSTLSLMTLTLMALGLVARQFKRAAG